MCYGYVITSCHVHERYSAHSVEEFWLPVLYLQVLCCLSNRSSLNLLYCLEMCKRDQTIPAFSYTHLLYLINHCAEKRVPSITSKWVQVVSNLSPSTPCPVTSTTMNNLTHFIFSPQRYVAGEWAFRHAILRHALRGQPEGTKVPTEDQLEHAVNK